MKSSTFYRALFLVLLLALLGTELAPPELKAQLTFYTFQKRDLIRAQALASGHPIFFGPETTGGGHLYGAFYYYLLAPSQLIAPGWQSAFTEMMVLFYFGGVIGAWWIRRQLGSLAAVLWLILYSVTRPLRIVLGLFLNISYLFLFSLLQLIWTCTAFTHPDAKKRNQATRGALLVAGLGIQLHFSQLILLLAFLVLWILSDRLSLRKPSNRALLHGMGIFLLTLLPYFVWATASLAGHPFGQPVLYSGSTLRALPVLGSFFLRGLQLPWSTLVANAAAKLQWMLPITLVWIGVTAAIGRTFRWPVLPCEKDSTADRLVRISAVCSVVCFFPFTYFFFSFMGFRYGTPFVMSAILFVTALFHRLLKSSARLLATYTVLCFGYIFVIAWNWGDTAGYLPELWEFALISLTSLGAGIAAGWMERDRRVRRTWVALAVALTIASIHFQAIHQSFAMSRLYRNVNPVYTTWESALTTIYTQTGWTYEDAIDRIYFINHPFEHDPEPVYRDVAQHTPVNLREDKPDGYFVDLAEARNLSLTPLQWILAQPIQEEIRQALVEGSLILGKPQEPLLFTVIPYWTRDTHLTPKHLHNLGAGYYPPANPIPLHPSSEGAVLRDPLAPQRVWFAWNECPDHDAYCTTGASIDWEELSGQRFRMHVVAYGPALGQVSPYISPNWTQSWVAPFVEVVCEGRPRRLSLATSLGYRTNHGILDPGYLNWLTNNSFVTPFARDFEVRCPGQITEIALGRKASRVEQLTSTLFLPSRRLSYSLTGRRP